MEKECICPRDCDCENPEPANERGAALKSQHCPTHNFNPKPYPDCLAEKHWWEET